MRRRLIIKCANDSVKDYIEYCRSNTRFTESTPLDVKLAYIKTVMTSYFYITEDLFTLRGSSGAGGFTIIAGKKPSVSSGVFSQIDMSQFTVLFSDAPNTDVHYFCAMVLSNFLRFVRYEAKRVGLNVVFQGPHTQSSTNHLTYSDVMSVLI